MTGAVDTDVFLGILLPGTDRADRTDRLLARYPEVKLVAPPQVVYESLVVLTRPLAANGIGLPPADAERAILAALESVRLIPDPDDLPLRLLALCRRHEVIGKSAHDARIAAWAIAQNVDRLFTLDPNGFARFGIPLA